MMETNLKRKKERHLMEAHFHEFMAEVIGFLYRWKDKHGTNKEKIDKMRAEVLEKLNSIKAF